MPHTASNLLVHFIFSTKQRFPFIEPAIASDLHAYLGGIIREIGGKALIVNGTADHVHLLVRVPTTHSIADVARVVKTNSSRWVHKKWARHIRFGWQTGYGAFSVSESGTSLVKDYIARQREHHLSHTFQQEYRAFLHKNRIVVDERYLWD